MNLINNIDEWIFPILHWNVVGKFPFTLILSIEIFSFTIAVAKVYNLIFLSPGLVGEKKVCKVLKEWSNLKEKKSENEDTLNAVKKLRVVEFSVKETCAICLRSSPYGLG